MKTSIIVGWVLIAFIIVIFSGLIRFSVTRSWIKRK